jgi:single-strand DNA-binding protein
MAGLNKVEIIGTLGQDPEVRYAGNGNAICNLSLATSEKWKDAQGNPQERTEWHRVSMFGKVAEIAGEYLRKGSECYVCGKLQTREWEKDGVKRYTTEIVVDGFDGRRLLLLRGGGTRQSNDNGQGGNQQRQQPQGHGAPRTQQQAPRQQQAPSPQPDFDSFDDDIPF